MLKYILATILVALPFSFSAPQKCEAGIFRQRARVSSPGLFRQLTFAPSARGRR